MRLKCPKCWRTGGKEAFDYKHPVLVPNEEPYATVWYEWFLWLCYGCGTYFVSTKEIER